MERFLAFCQRAFLVLLIVCVPMYAIGTYTMTQGSGLTFGDIEISTVHYAAHVICDATAGNTQCAAVTSGNALKVDASATTQPVSSTTLATAANQATANTSLASIATSAATTATNTGAAIPTQATSVPIGGVSNDPCAYAAKTNVPISTASGTLALVTGVSAKKIYVCSLVLIAPSAVSVSLAEGSGTTCGTSNQAGVIGVATNGTAANGMPLAANGGLTLGNGGGSIAITATAADYLCLFQSGTAQIAGNLTYVQQ